MSSVPYHGFKFIVKLLSYQSLTRIILLKRPYI